MPWPSQDALCVSLAPPSALHRRCRIALSSGDASCASCTFPGRSAGSGSNKRLHSHRSMPCDAARLYRSRSCPRGGCRSPRPSSGTDALGPRRWWCRLQRERSGHRHRAARRRARARRRRAPRRPTLTPCCARWRRSPDPSLGRRRCQVLLRSFSPTTQSLLSVVSACS